MIDEVTDWFPLPHLSYREPEVKRMTDQPKKLTLYHINNYLIDHLERPYAPPFSDCDYICVLCGRVWDAQVEFDKKHWRVTPDGWILYDPNWVYNNAPGDWTCGECINPVVNFQELIDAHQGGGK